MLECPKCHRSVESTAIACPYCRATLKAFGHPGVPLYRAEGEAALCESCIYHEDDSCNYPQRPNARECTLYTSGDRLQEVPVYRLGAASLVRGWIQQNLAWVLLGLLLLVSFLIALGR